MASTIRRIERTPAYGKCWPSAFSRNSHSSAGTYSAAGARAALEHQRNIEMALESRALCKPKISCRLTLFASA